MAMDHASELALKLAGRDQEALRREIEMQLLHAEILMKKVGGKMTRINAHMTRINEILMKKVGGKMTRFNAHMTRINEILMKKVFGKMVAADILRCLQRYKSAYRAYRSLNAA
jgi:hypothetical protein